MLNTPDNEKQLLIELCKGSEQAFEKIYQQYSARLFGNLLKLVKSEAEAQEILQDVFLKVWNNRKMLDPERSFRSYLFKIAENKVYDFYRAAARNKKREALLAEYATTGYPAVEELLLDEKKSAILGKAIDALPPQRQQIFRLCKLEGKSYKEVSILLGISTSTISDHIVKATKSIRDYFESNDPALPGLLLLAFLTTVP